MTAVIELDGVGKRYWQLQEQAMLLKSLIPGRGTKKVERWALRDINFSVNAGETVGILGHNGAGKTTLLNCVTGDFPPTAGTVRFFGEDVTTLPPHERIRRGLRRTYQISLLFSRLSVRDNVYLACRGVSRGRYSFLRPRRNDALVHAAETLIQAVHLTAIKDRLVTELAYGQQRQLEVALTLAGAPRFLLFDDRAVRTGRHPLFAPLAYRLHHHRTRHGRRAARRRERDHDA